jgi:hypothetical protein
MAAVIPTAQTLHRSADGSVLAGSISIFTRTQLTAGGKMNDTSSRQADIVTWHGRAYVVSAVEDYSAFGPGFWRVEADLLPLNPTVNS